MALTSLQFSTETGIASLYRVLSLSDVFFHVIPGEPSSFSLDRKDLLVTLRMHSQQLYPVCEVQRW